MHLSWKYFSCNGMKNLYKVNSETDAYCSNVVNLCFIDIVTESLMQNMITYWEIENRQLLWHTRVWHETLLTSYIIKIMCTLPTSIITSPTGLIIGNHLDPQLFDSSVTMKIVPIFQCWEYGRSVYNCTSWLDFKNKLLPTLPLKCSVAF